MTFLKKIVQILLENYQPHRLYLKAKFISQSMNHHKEQTRVILVTLISVLQMMSVDQIILTF